MNAKRRHRRQRRARGKVWIVVYNDPDFNGATMHATITGLKTTKIRYYSFQKESFFVPFAFRNT